MALIERIQKLEDGHTMASADGLHAHHWICLAATAIVAAVALWTAVLPRIP